MADIIFWKLNDFRGTLYTRAFGVADCEFDIGFPFFEIAVLRRVRLFNFSHNQSGNK